MNYKNLASPQTVVSQIDSVCYQYPNHVALIYQGQELTYHELSQRAEKLYSYLKAQNNLEPNTLVGVCLEPSFEMVIAIYAILKAGAAFVPLDPDLPRQRLSYMISDAKLTTILTVRKFAFDIEPALRQSDVVGHMCFLDTLSWGEDTLQFTAPIVEPEQLAYIIYTSGSTGTPKGVMLPHRGLLNLACSSIHAFDINPGTRVLQFASISFDAAVWELVTALCGAGTLVLGAREEMLPGRPLAEFIAKYSIEMLCLPPSVLATLMQFREQLSCLRVIAAGGEACPLSLAQFWVSANTRFFNAYGPTEITVCATMFEFKTESLSVPIGNALPNVELYILDEERNLCESGQKGELYIGGVGVAQGYLGKEEMTCSRFISNPFGTGKIYKTGDIVYEDLCHRGLLHYVGRVDNQVKIRGLRVELEAIEKVLGQHPSVQATVVKVITTTDVITKENKSHADGTSMLVGYVVPRAGFFVTDKRLQQFAAEHLPDYMVPVRFVFLDELPLMPNRSKVDRSSLPELELIEFPVTNATNNAIKIAAIFDEALQLTPGSFLPNSNFFDMGGDSLRIAHILWLIQRDFGVTISSRLVYEYPTPSDLARLLEFKQTCSDVDDNSDLMTDALLPSYLDTSIWHKPAIVKFDTAFITGSTGFLGAHLLHELLIKNSYRNIYCLVRAENDTVAMQKLRATFIKYQLPTVELTRVEVIAGDIEQPRMQLPVTLFEKLSQSVDVIYHVAADTNYIKPYSVIKKPNLDGTANIIAFAAHRHHKTLHYLSTLAVYGAASSFFNMDEVSEDYDIDISLPIMSVEYGYVRAKWTAERMVQTARLKGLNCSIYRPGFISGHKQNCIANLADTFHRSVSGCIQMGAYPDLPEKYWGPVPVDFVAAAITHISTNSQYTGGNYNLTVPRIFELSHVEMFEYINDLGYRVEKISLKAWLKAISTLPESNPLYPLGSFWQEKVYQNRSTLLEIHHRTPTFRIDNTLRAIRGSGLEFPKFDKALVKYYLPNFTNGIHAYTEAEMLAGKI
jgi:amino acid adenylation domain-containing protein/thioester reductase-like protein